MKKNLRKVLAVVLVFALAFSLMAVAGAVSGAGYTSSLNGYTDASSITNQEAVETLTSLGVLAGNAGTYNPAGTLTREEAAKLVAYANLGAAASTLQTSTSSFNDVAASRWSAPFIEYCASKGIINGYGNGAFGPTDNVTAAQLAKMLLVSIGYGAKGELTGNSWMINAISQAQVLKILTTGVDYSKAATRDQAAEYVFNALTATAVVTYSTLMGSYTTTAINSTAPGQTLGYNVFGLMSATQAMLTAEGIVPSTPYILGGRYTTTTSMGYDSVVWTNTNSVTLSSPYSTDTILGTCNGMGPLTQGALYTKYSWDPSVKVYENGAWVLTDSASQLAVNGSVVYATGPAGIDANGGAKCDFVDQNGDGAVDAIVISHPYLGEVTSVSTATPGAQPTLQVNVWTSQGMTTAVTIAPSNSINTTGYAMNDYVLVTPNMTGDTGMALNTAVPPVLVPVAAPVTAAQLQAGLNNPNALSMAKTATGTLSAYDYPFFVTTSSGTIYGISSYVFDSTLPAALNTTTTYTYYLDTYGNFIGLGNATTTSLPYLYVTDAYLTTNTSAISGGTEGVNVNVTYTNGTTAILKLHPDASDDTAYWYNADGSANAISLTGLNGATGDITNNPLTLVSGYVDSVPSGFYSYTTATDGSVSLTAAATTNAIVPAAGTTVSFGATNNTATVMVGTAMYYASSATVLSTVTSAAGQTTYTGQANFPSFSQAVSAAPGAGATLGVLAADNTGNKVLLVMDTTTPNLVDFIYVINGSSSTSGQTLGLVTAIDGTNATGQVFDLSMNGTTVKGAVIPTGDNTATVPGPFWAPGGVYNISKNSDGTYSIANPTTSGVSGQVTVSDPSFLTLNNGAPVYMATSGFGGIYDASTGAKTTLAAGQTVTYFTNSANPGQIIDVYVLSAGVTTTTGLLTAASTGTPVNSLNLSTGNVVDSHGTVLSPAQVDTIATAAGTTGVTFSTYSYTFPGNLWALNMYVVINTVV
jgi:hypothetical protein